MTPLRKLPREFEALSKTAKTVGSLFGMMTPGKSEGLIFGMQQSRPSLRCQQGLDELVAAKIIQVRRYNRAGGLQYQPLVDCRPFFQWMAKHQKDPDVKFPIAEPFGKEPTA